MPFNLNEHDINKFSRKGGEKPASSPELEDSNTPVEKNDQQEPVEEKDNEQKL